LIKTPTGMTSNSRFLVILLLSLTGCALFPNWHWEKRGATDGDYALDERDCKVQSYSGTDGTVTKASVRRMHTCLEARGWRKVED